jgi:alpha-L-arabinofuranosidase
VHRGTKDPVQLRIAIDSFKAGPEAEVWSLSADVPWAANSLRAPQAVSPKISATRVIDNTLAIELRPYSVLRIRVPAGK